MDGDSLSVDCSPTGNGWRCMVTVGDDARATTHEVSVGRAEMERYAPGDQEPTRLVEESFRFMLEREPRDAILRRFDLPVIERYFPEYAGEIRARR